MDSFGGRWSPNTILQHLRQINSALLTPSPDYSSATEPAADHQLRQLLIHQPPPPSLLHRSMSEEKHLSSLTHADNSHDKKKRKDKKQVRSATITERPQVAGPVNNSVQESSTMGEMKSNLSMTTPVATTMTGPLISPSDSVTSTPSTNETSLTTSSVQSSPTNQPPESLIRCIEKFLLCEHKNSLNIFLYLGTLTLFVSKTLSQKLGIVPETNRSNITYKTMVACGLLLQLIFEFKNCERSTYTTVVRRFRNAFTNGDNGNNGNPIYSSAGSSSLSPPPLSGSPFSAFANQPVLSNITAVDRQLEGFGTSLIMCAINFQLLKAYFHREASEVWQVNSYPILSLPTIAKIYSLFNVMGVLASVKQLVTSICAKRVDPSDSDPPRSLPLILPSFSFIQLIHALFLRPQLEPRVDHLVTDIGATMVGATLSKPPAVAPNILQTMATLSLYYWSIHNKHFANGHAKEEGLMYSSSSNSLANQANLSTASQWNSAFGYNIKIILCLLLFTKEMA